MQSEKVMFHCSLLLRKFVFFFYLPDTEIIFFPYLLENFKYSHSTAKKSNSVLRFPVNSVQQTLSVDLHSVIVVFRKSLQNSVLISLSEKFFRKTNNTKANIIFYAFYIVSENGAFWFAKNLKAFLNSKCKTRYFLTHLWNYYHLYTIYMH